MSLPLFPGPQGSVGHPLLHSFLYSANPWAVPGAGDLATEIEEPRARKKCRALGQSKSISKQGQHVKPKHGAVSDYTGHMSVKLVLGIAKPRLKNPQPLWNLGCGQQRCKYILRQG